MKPILLLCCPLFCDMQQIVVVLCFLFDYMKQILLLAFLAYGSRGMFFEDWHVFCCVFLGFHPPPVVVRRKAHTTVHHRNHSEPLRVKLARAARLRISCPTVCRRTVVCNPPSYRRETFICRMVRTVLLHTKVQPLAAGCQSVSSFVVKAWPMRLVSTCQYLWSPITIFRHTM